MGRPPKVDHVRWSLETALDSASTLHANVSRLSAVRAAANVPRLHPKQAHRVVELAFMGAIAAWEDFLEETTIRYLAGAIADSGYSPRLRLGKCENIEHAYRIYSGNPAYDATKQYLNWRDPTSVIAAAKLFFYQGHPYTLPLTNFGARLKDAVKIRDRVAHSSTKAREDFNKVARRLRGGPLHQGYRVGDLLTSNANNNFGHTTLCGGKTVFGAYVTILKECATRVVP